MKKTTVGFVCFGEVNTPIERLQMKHDEALAALQAQVEGVVDGGLVIDDPAYETADAAYAKLAGLDMSCLVVCVAGWVPTHAVVRVTDHFRHVPMVLWGLCGWKESGRIITTAEQAGTTALRPAFEALDYTCKYVYNIIGKEWPMEKITSYIAAACAKKNLRSARVGTMGYRDMLLYGTQFEGNSMRGQIGVEVEPYEMLEMVRAIDTLEAEKIAESVKFVKENWVFKKECDDSVIEKQKMMSLFFSKEGKHIVCGGTTSTLAAEFLGTVVDVGLPLYLDPEIPPTSKIKGVDLVTEGVITFNRVVEYAKNYLEDNDSYSQWSYKNDGASLIARMLFEEATDINFFVGRAMNPAHQSPDLPINFNIKMRLVDELSTCLRKMDKQIKVSYF